MEQPPEDAAPPPEQPASPVAASPTGPDAAMLGLGALMFLVSFLAWYRLEYSIPGVRRNIVSFNAWRAGFFSWSSVIIATATAAFAGMRVAGTQLKLRASAGSIYLLSGVTVFVFVALRFLIKPGLPILFSQFVKVTRGFGIILGLVLAIGMLVTGWRAYQAERRR